jgi:hypothetical protein
METITSDDLRQFRLQLIGEIKELLNGRKAPPDYHMPPEWIKSSVARKILDMSPGTLQNLRISGKVRFQRIGGSYYYSREDLNALFQNDPLKGA